MKLQNLINHIALVVDASGSMAPLSTKVVEVFDAELENLKKRSVEFNQETRISIYLFRGTKTDCLVSDMDVMRLGSLAEHYSARGGTPLVSATCLALSDMKLFPTKYGDHSFLVYVLTDGEENTSEYDDKKRFPALVQNLAENWTLACLVPNQLAMRTATAFGFPKECLGIWDVSEKGLKAQGEILRSSLDTYMVNRAAGVRGTKTFFNQVSTKDLTRTDVTGFLNECDPKHYRITLNDTTKAKRIDDTVRDGLKINYVVGRAYYELVKKEKIHNGKQIVIQDRKNGKVYAGAQSRRLLGIPDGETNVCPGDFGMWKIFVQSTSVNRNVIPNQNILVFV